MEASLPRPTWVGGEDDFVVTCMNQHLVQHRKLINALVGDITNYEGGAFLITGEALVPAAKNASKIGRSEKHSFSGFLKDAFRFSMRTSLAGSHLCSRSNCST